VQPHHHEDLEKRSRTTTLVQDEKEKDLKEE
jgi:hypothetical protein